MLLIFRLDNITYTLLGIVYKVVCLLCRRWTSHSNGAAARNNNQPASAGGGTGTATGGTGSATRAPARHRGTRMVRSVGRGRGSAGVIVGRPLIPANVVPEDLINQVGIFDNREIGW